MIKGVMIMEVSWLAEQNVAFSSSSAASSSGSTSPVSPAPRKEHVRYDDVTRTLGLEKTGLYTCNETPPAAGLRQISPPRRGT